ncbi:MAG TPA: hypothetical protein VGD07_06970 [Methylomirabilota bacterium]
MTKDLTARREAKGGILPYIEQDNISTSTGAAGPHVVPTQRTLSR